MDIEREFSALEQDMNQQSRELEESSREMEIAAMRMRGWRPSIYGGWIPIDMDEKPDTAESLQFTK